EVREYRQRVPAHMSTGSGCSMWVRPPSPFRPPGKCCKIPAFEQLSLRPCAERVHCGIDTGAWLPPAGRGHSTPGEGLLDTCALGYGPASSGISLGTIACAQPPDPIFTH